MVLYLYQGRLGIERLRHEPNNWQFHQHLQILFGHWVVNRDGGSIAVRYSRGYRKIKLQVWVSDSARIDLRKQPILQKNIYFGHFLKNVANFTTTNGDEIVISLKLEELRFQSAYDRVERSILSLNVTSNGRKLTHADAAKTMV
jgi:hypothetical protein